MTVINRNTIDMNLITVTGRDGREVITRTEEAVSKIHEAVVKPDGSRYAKEEIRFAMFTDPYAIGKALGAAYGLDVIAWTTGGPDTKSDVDVGSLVGRRVRIERRVGKWPNETTKLLEGAIISEKPITYDDEGEDRPSTDLTVRLDSGKIEHVQGRYAGWEILLGDEWIEPYELADRVEDERAVTQTAGRLTGKKPNVKRHRRRR